MNSCSDYSFCTQKESQVHKSASRPLNLFVSRLSPLRRGLKQGLYIYLINSSRAIMSLSIIIKSSFPVCHKRIWGNEHLFLGSSKKKKKKPLFLGKEGLKDNNKKSAKLANHNLNQTKEYLQVMLNTVSWR